MRVQIKDEQIIIGEEVLPFYGYYFAIEADRKDQPWLMVVKDVLSQWAAAIATLEDNQVAYLPYSLEDEWVECIETKRRGENIIFRCVDVAGNGYSLVLDDLKEFMLSRQKLDNFRDHPEMFGEYNRQEIISALKNAEIADA